MRIQGLVRLLNRVQEQFHLGVTPSRLAELQREVAQAVAQTEAICREAGVRPQSLPGPSRNAYRYLKGIDFSQIATIDSTTARAPAPRVRNLVKAMRDCQQRIWELAEGRWRRDGLADLIERVNEQTAAVEAICARSDATPAALPKPSRNAYALLKFLSQNDNLAAQVDAVRRVASIVRRHDPKCSTLFIEFTNFANIWQREQRGRYMHIRLNEAFLWADDDVFEAIAQSALGRRGQEQARVIDAFQSSEAASDVMAELALAAGEEPLREAGAVYHLGHVFSRVNRQYFDGTMDRPKLAWARSVSYRSFGHYVFATDTVLLSASLDRPDVPKFVVDYIMFHELLHKKHGVKVRNRRRMTHTAAFRRDENRFERRPEADEFLRNYSRKLGSRH